MIKRKNGPPPIIDSAKLLAFAYNEDDVVFTDNIDIFVGKKDELVRLGEMPCLAICSNSMSPKEVFLFLCNSEWVPQGVIVFSSVEKAKQKAEKGYMGISTKWINSPYTQDDIDKFLRDMNQVLNRP